MSAPLVKVQGAKHINDIVDWWTFPNSRPWINYLYVWTRYPAFQLLKKISNFVPQGSQAKQSKY